MCFGRKTQVIKASKVHIQLIYFLRGAAAPHLTYEKSKSKPFKGRPKKKMETKEQTGPQVATVNVVDTQQLLYQSDSN